MNLAPPEEIIVDEDLILDHYIHVEESDCCPIAAGAKIASSHPPGAIKVDVGLATITFIDIATGKFHIADLDTAATRWQRLLIDWVADEQEDDEHTPPGDLSDPFVLVYDPEENIYHMKPFENTE